MKDSIRIDHKKVADHLDKAFNVFLNLFNDDMRNALIDKAYFAGGCIYCLSNGKPVNDYDLFLSDAKHIADLERLDLWRCKSDYALSRGMYQLVTKYHGKPRRCVGQFDFKHNMYFYKPYSGEIQTACGEFESLFTSQLIFNEKRARDIEGVFLRIERFVKRGFSISPDTIAQIKKRTTPKKVKKYERKIKQNRRISRNDRY